MYLPLCRTLSLFQARFGTVWIDLPDRRMASHKELIDELPKLEKMTNAQRQKHAKKRRKKQLQKCREWEIDHYGENRSSTSSLKMKQRDCKVQFDKCAHLNEAVMRNDVSEGNSPYLTLCCSGWIVLSTDTRVGCLWDDRS